MLIKRQKNQTLGKKKQAEEKCVLTVSNVDKYMSPRGTKPMAEALP